MLINSSQKEKNTLRTVGNVIFYRNLKHQKIVGLKLHNGKFDANITLNVESKK